MKIKKSTLRRVIRQQLREAVEGAAGAVGNPNLSDPELNQLFAAIDTVLQAEMGELGVEHPWSVEAIIGKKEAHVGKRSAQKVQDNEKAVEQLMQKALSEPAMAKIREKLKLMIFNRKHRIAAILQSNKPPVVKAIQSKEIGPDEDPDPSPCYRTTKYNPCYPKGDDCVIAQQKAMGLKADGIWGENTEKAWVKLGLGARPADANDLPACKKQSPSVDCPPGQRFDGPTGECVPMQGGTADCEARAKKLWAFLRRIGEDNPIAHPDTYVKLTDKNILGLFAGDPEVAQVDQAVKETQALFKKLVTCDGSGCEKGHSIAANQLIAKLRSNVDIFNNSWRNVLDRAVNSGKSNLVDAAAEVWEYTRFADYFGSLPGGTTLPPNLIKMTKLDNRGEAPIRKIGDMMNTVDCPAGSGVLMPEGWSRWQTLSGIKS